MRFLVFSDSHGAYRLMADMTARNIGHADGILFLGDGCRDLFRLKTCYPQFAYIAVAGNCDSFVDFGGQSVEPQEILTVEGHRILLVHGHRQFCKFSDRGLLDAAAELHCDVVLHGHTHAPRCDRETLPDGNTVLLCNPGSVHDTESCGVLELEGDRVTFHTASLA